jgi:hypothetical protein
MPFCPIFAPFSRHFRLIFSRFNIKNRPKCHFFFKKTRYRTDLGPDWRYEGVIGYGVSDPGSVSVSGSGSGDKPKLLDPSAVQVPLYRYYNVHRRDHFYTTLWNEVQSGTHGWLYQGVAGLVAPPGPATATATATATSAATATDDPTATASATASAGANAGGLLPLFRCVGD